MQFKQTQRVSDYFKTRKLYVIEDFHRIFRIQSSCFPTW